MTLKELRQNKGMTQQEAALLLQVSLRSYKDYENDPFKADSIKYKYMFEKLQEANLIDEEHGILKVEDIKKIIESVLTNYNVNFCYLFGSYAKKYATEKSDVDLLIDTEITGLKFFGLVEELRNTLRKKVDVLTLEQLEDNQLLLKEIFKDGIKIYG